MSSRVDTVTNVNKYAHSASSPRQIVYASEEVIVAAGAIHSAQLLQLSGFGPAPVLEAANISVAIDMPGVGSNMQDHCLVGTFYPCQCFLIIASFC